jgi:hypothetical protein
VEILHADIHTCLFKNVVSIKNQLHRFKIFNLINFQACTVTTLVKLTAIYQNIFNIVQKVSLTLILHTLIVKQILEVLVERINVMGQHTIQSISLKIRMVTCSNVIQYFSTYSHSMELVLKQL